jgi:hypothetical protein
MLGDPFLSSTVTCTVYTELWESRNYMNTVLWADSAPEQWHFHKCSPAQTQLGGSSVRATLAEVGRAALAVAVPRPTHHFRSIPRLEKCAQKSI